MNDKPHEPLSGDDELSAVKLTMHALGQLGEDERAEVEARLLEDAEARELHSQLAKAGEALESAYDWSPLPPASAELRYRLAQEFDEQKPSPRRSRGRKILIAGGATAACLALVIAGMAFFSRPYYRAMSGSRSQATNNLRQHGFAYQPRSQNETGRYQVNAHGYYGDTWTHDSGRLVIITDGSNSMRRIDDPWLEGRGRDDDRIRSGDQFAPLYENPFQAVGVHPLSTFSIDVDTASYSKVRQYLNDYGQMPPPDAVRIEELVNYFPYDYLPPMGPHPFAAHMEVAQCPWRPQHRLARIAIKGREINRDRRPLSNLVFLLDVSGSMNDANKLPLVKKGMKMLVGELGENDRVAIVVYAGAAGVVLPSTRGDHKARIDAALDRLQAGGSTAGAEGIQLAYQIARDNFIQGGTNRVLLCTDGDFNVGLSDTGGLVRMAEKEAKHGVYLSILGFGMGNHNDAMLEQVSCKANGTYAFIDTEKEARKVLVEQLSGTLVTIAKDVKIQVEFNPAKVKGYRLIGYENRMLAAEDFNDDKKDAGEIGAGHTVTALYEIVPMDAKVDVDAAPVDDLKYQRPAALTDAADSDELLTLKLRYKLPEGDKSTLISFPIEDNAHRFSETSDDFQFAAAVTSFGMLLRGSAYAGNATFDGVAEIAGNSLGDDEWGYRKEFLNLVRKAKEVGR